jgi:hypothetical protein
VNVCLYRASNPPPVNALAVRFTLPHAAPGTDELVLTVEKNDHDDVNIKSSFLKSEMIKDFKSIEYDQNITYGCARYFERWYQPWCPKN